MLISSYRDTNGVTRWRADHTSSDLYRTGFRTRVGARWWAIRAVAR